MRFLEFKHTFSKWPVFTYNEIFKVEPGFHRKRLVEWQKAGYIKKIRNGYYCFSDTPDNDYFKFYLANRLYVPSYISLESALSFYNLIPEAVFNFISVGTLKTNSFETPFGRYNYRNIKPLFYFGYRLIKEGDLTIKIADPEKMMLDYCYFNKPTGIKDFESLRIDKTELLELLDMKKFETYLSLYQSRIMVKRSNLFKTYLNA